jgi:hypothetical protein
MGGMGLACVVLGLATLLTGCKPSAPVSQEVKVAGSYALVSVDGKQIPCVVKHEGQDGPMVKSGTFVINADGTCSSKIAFVAPGGGGASREVKATYTREGAKLTMKWEGAGMTTGTVEGNSFTMENEGILFVYRKQAP